MMAAIISTIKGRVLIQVADMDPVEVGTVEIPIHVGTEGSSVKSDGEAGKYHVEMVIHNHPRGISDEETAAEAARWANSSLRST